MFDENLVVTSCPGPGPGPSRLDYCNALLAGLPSNTIKPLQMIQNAAARLVFNKPKRAHVTPLFVSLHWLPVAARIKFKTLMLAYRTSTGSASTYFHSLLRIYIPSRSPAYFHSLLRIYIPSRSPAYFHSLLRIYIPSWSLRSASERRLVVPSQRGSKSLSRTFSFTVPGCWNDLPTLIRTAGSLTIFKQWLKTHLFQLYLTSSKKKKKRCLSLYLLLLLLACTYMNNAWDLVLWALPLSVWLFKMNRFVYSPIVIRFG